MNGQNRGSMKGLKPAIAALTAAAALAVAGPVWAQAPGPAAAAPAAGAAAAVSDEAPPIWVRLCSPDPTTQKSLCLVQEEIDADTGQFIASAAIQSAQGDPTLQFIIGVPPGLLIQPGMQLQVDSGKAAPLKYAICQPNTCFAEMDITADFIKSLRSGKQIVVTAYNQAAQTVQFSLALDTFAKAYDSAGIDPSTPAGQATVDALTASLKQHADTVRQRLIAQQEALVAN